MSVPTYYHDSLPGVTALLHDSLPPAASERLKAIGWQLWMLSASETIESVETIEEKVKMIVKLQASKEHYAATTSSVVLIVDGKGHFDIEAFNFRSMWIRVMLTPGVLLHIPGGAHTRIASENPEGSPDVLM
ncbi:hypothetical protein J3R30DRAFT_3404427 [Lentinula aciculospora]|uniref:Uncharacterized protein n=1 Tax=Lentinula aciculospora TaxID=153920 RepID=A0A9W9AAR1_9AGAR|nr:hypothetical protein J3R30DRAFT_3404427 [Lentinula aciculospora]